MPRAYRPAPPPPAHLIRWPAAFGTRFTVLCDVEEEFDWRQPLSRAARSTAAMAAFPGAHRRFAELGVPLTCMVDHPVATDAAAAAAIAQALEDGCTALGAQLHPWVNPPFDEAITPANSYGGNLPPALEAAKIDVLTDALVRAFGRAPVAFRAGRYGLGPVTLRLLAARGYRIDCSVRARYDYRADGGPDYRAIGNDAYRADGVVELPFTTVFTGRLRRRGPTLYDAAGLVRHGRGVLARAGLVNRVSLTPEDMPVAEALEAVRVAVGEGTRLLTLAFHSPSLQPGHTPYVRDAAELATFWSWWDRVTAELDRLGVHGATMAEVLAASDEA